MVRQCDRPSSWAKSRTSRQLTKSCAAERGREPCGGASRRKVHSPRLWVAKRCPAWLLPAVPTAPVVGAPVLSMLFMVAVVMMTMSPGPPIAPVVGVAPRVGLSIHHLWLHHDRWWF